MCPKYANMLKWTITALYRAAYAKRVFGPGGCFAPPKDARKISKILTCRCSTDQRGTKADNYDRWRGRRSPLSATPRATVTYATYDVLSVHTSASRTWRSLPSPSPLKNVPRAVPISPMQKFKFAVINKN